MNINILNSVLSAFLLIVIINHSQAHELGMSGLTIKQEAARQFTYEWTPAKKLFLKNGLNLIVPEFCQQMPRQVRCADIPQTVRWGIKELPPHADVILTFIDQDEITKTFVINYANPSVTLDIQQNSLSLFTYLILGIEHIILGIDHLLFVLGILLLIKAKIPLIKTITAFTIAHSLTLGLALYGIINFSSTFVEVMIALSILLLAIELTIDRPTLTQSFPWLVAFAFGLIHGLGFAGAIGEIGLPQAQFAWSLLLFNIGVELGQLFVIAAVFAIQFFTLSISRKLAWPFPYRSIRAVSAVVMGSVSVFWFLDRSELLNTSLL